MRKPVEFVPLIVDCHTAQLQYGLRTSDRPMHAGAFEPIVDHMPACALDDPGRNRIARREVLVITHPFLMLLEIPADPFDLLADRRRHRLRIRPVPKQDRQAGGLAAQQPHGVTPHCRQPVGGVGIEGMRHLPQHRSRMQEIENLHPRAPLQRFLRIGTKTMLTVQENDDRLMPSGSRWGTSSPSQGKIASRAFTTVPSAVWVGLAWTVLAIGFGHRVSASSDDEFTLRSRLRLDLGRITRHGFRPSAPGHR